MSIWYWQASDVEDREFLIVIITTNSSVCHGMDYTPDVSFNVTGNKTWIFTNLFNFTCFHVDPFEQELTLQVKSILPRKPLYWT